MHEGHRSPYPSPSQSPRRWGKCPREKRFRIARRSLWPRPKHRVGLERPHFVATETVAVAPAQHNFLRCLARVPSRIVDEIGEGGR